MNGVGKDLSARIEDAHARLNSEAILPPLAHRRNATVYALVCYVNNIIGCYLSGNLRAIPLFIERAGEHMVSNPPPPETEAYYKEVSTYLEVMEAVVRAK